MKSLPLKVVLIGDTLVGKTSIATRYVNGDFNESYKGTVAANFLHKLVEINDYSCDLAIWDTAGQEIYRTLTPNYYRDANIAIIVFDITSMNTFKQVKSWINEVKTNVQDIIIMVVGNKHDLEANRAVSMDEANELCQSFGVEYVETSALTGYGIDIVFETVVINYIKSMNQKSFKFDTPNRVDLNNEKSSEKNKKSCC
ncbi:small GTP-binding protein, putative [Trichomonas vaginalis G3]|uniref:Small GTP-binding protein, putative n=1 Tax=Trichomonas vaginalis (strain ATCC PRA-98 / G3) TaxID=412133 RepID=A2ESY6_TRIV3|nr:retrograde vesicle-mediated transport, Golgi to ER [Trichomonas vaginalis G3]EAY04244.1 small GTP-binding protein, putative [Trichomonas vaginalis G3]KAI5550015.1 retrograde vesicle-mediated transport, Golgi to ER [Trichomonas vaginalis G3]|eukprot:XP_001316467.1 small GTP-binding protein [Trichomonas vaginalis G3]